MGNDIRTDRLTATVSNAPIPIIVFDRESQIVEWNGAAARLFDASPEAALGQPLGKFFSVGDGVGPETWPTRIKKMKFMELSAQGRRQGDDLFPVHMVATLLTETDMALYVIRSGDELAALNTLRPTDESQQKADLLNAIIDGELSNSEAAIKRGRSLGMDLSARYALFAISIDGYQGKSFTELQKDQRKMKEALQQVTYICSSEHDKIVWTRYDGFVVLCPLPENCTDIKNHAMARAKSGKERVIRHLPDAELTVGVSSSYTDVMDIPKCYREAREAVNVGQRIWGGNGVYHYADLGICQLLTQLHDPRQLQAFVERFLGKLIRQDAEKGSQLVMTLEEILATSSLKEAAERCFIHHKTILARKNKIESILGVAIDDVETRLTLSTAMKILRLLPE